MEVTCPSKLEFDPDYKMQIAKCKSQNERGRRGGLPRHLRNLWQDFRRHPLLVFLIVSLLLLIGLGAYSGIQAIRAEQQLRAARRALDQSDLNGAQTHLTVCLALSPQSTEAHFLAAQTARRSGNYDQAEHHLDECTQLGCSREAIDFERTLARAQRGDLARIEDYLLSGIDKNQPEVVLILEALAQGYLATYRLADALHCLDLWLQRQPNNIRALIWRGEVKERRNKYAEAVAAYERAVQVEPNNDNARLHLAQALVRSDRAEEAQTNFEQLRQRRPDDPEVLLGLARCRRTLGKSDEAHQFLDQVLAADPGHVEALSEKGKLALQTGQLDAAEKWLRKAVAGAPYDRDTLYNLYQCLLQRGKRAEAQECLEKVEKVAADRQRIAELTRNITANPKDPALRYEAGIICLRNGQEPEGVRWLLSALVEDATHRPTHKALAKYYERAGQPQRAAYHRHWAGEDQAR
jgi:tetratricopeptide (TPR) repeat protein